MKKPRKTKTCHGHEELGQALQSLRQSEPMPSLQLSENMFLFEPQSLWLLQDIKHMNTSHEFKELFFSKNLSDTSYLSECQIDPIFITYAEMWRIAVDSRCPLLLLSALVFLRQVF